MQHSNSIRENVWCLNQGWSKAVARLLLYTKYIIHSNYNTPLTNRVRGPSCKLRTAVFFHFNIELKQATFLSYGRKPDVNISHARPLVSPKFSYNNVSSLPVVTRRQIHHIWDSFWFLFVFSTYFSFALKLTPK